VTVTAGPNGPTGAKVRAAWTRTSLASGRPADPFRERARRMGRRLVSVLGGEILFESASAELLDIVDAAYAGLPSHTFAGSRPRLRIALELLPGTGRIRAVPPPPSLGGGAGFLRATLDDSSFAVVYPQAGAALVTVSRDMLRFRYHVRYELIEFAVYLLAARSRGLVPLHAACVAEGGRGIVLAGASGAGKSTIALNCLAQGLKLVSEDSVMLEPISLRATGIASFLHLRRESLQYVPADWMSRVIGSPVIRRRSGVDKLEVDVRSVRGGCAARPVSLSAIIFASAARAGRGPLLTPLPPGELVRRLHRTQPYAVSQSQWPAFIRSVQQVPTFELRRRHHPQEAVEALHGLLSG